MNTHTFIQTKTPAQENLTEPTRTPRLAALASRLLLISLFWGMAQGTYATAYTTAAAGDVNNKANWSPVPPDFNTPGDTWNITLPMLVASAWSVTGNVTISEGGSIKDQGNTVTFNGHFTNNAEAGYTATGTAIFGSEFPQAIGGTAVTTFNNLIRTNNGLSFNANCVIKGDFTAKSFIVDGGNIIEYHGNFTVSTGNNLFTGTAFLNGTGTQTVTGNPDFHDLIISNHGSVILKSDEKVTGDLTLACGTLTDGGNTIYVARNIVGTGKESGAGGITLTGSAATIAGATIENLTLDNASDFTLIGNAVINGALTFKAGNLVIGDHTLTLNGTVAGMDGKKYLTGGETANLYIGATGSLGTLFFNQANPGVTNNIATLTMNGKDGTVTLGNKAAVGNTLALTAGTIADGGNTITLMGNITGTGTESGPGGVTMKGESATISGATIGKLELNNAAGFSLAGSATITDALVLTAGSLSLGGNTLSLNGTVSGMNAQNYLTGSATANLVVANNGTADLLFFDQSNDGVTNNIATLTIAGKGYSIVKLGNKMVSGKAIVLTKGQLQISDQALEINGTFSGSATDNIQGSPSASLTINTAANTGLYYFDQAAPGRTDNIATFTVNSTGGTVSLGSPVTISGALALDAGALADGGNVITVTGNITGTGSETGTGGVVMTGASPTISGVTLANLTVRVTTAASLVGDLTVTNVMKFAAGKLSIGGRTLTLNGTVEGMGPKNCLTGGPGSNLTIGSTGMLGTLCLDQTAKGISNALSAFKVVNESCSFTVNGSMAVGAIHEYAEHRKRNR